MGFQGLGEDGQRRYLAAPMDRRRVLRLMAGVGAAAVSGAALTGDASAAGFLRATAALNLRTKPRSSATIRVVIPAGGLVVDLGVSTNGYRKVSYQGIRGYAFESYLTTENGGSADPVSVIGAAITATAVNLRYDASPSGYILAVLPKGTRVQIGDRVVNGYREVIAGSQRGFIFDDYLEPEGGEGATRFTTTAALNLRREPSTSAKVILVIPAGETVLDYDLVMSGAFRGVEYKGKTGWVSNAYLAQS